MLDSPNTRRVALITGGTGAIGSATSRLLANDGGYNIAFTCRSNEDRRRNLESELAQTTEVMSAPVDLTNYSDVSTFVDRILARFGRIDAVIHAGGPYVPQRFVSQLDQADFASHVDQELLSFFNLARLTLDELRSTRGSIVAVTTVAVRRFPVKDALSASPKAGVEALVRAIAVEEGRFGVRANCVGPGIMEDGLASQLTEQGEFDERSQDFAIQRIPLRRFGRSHEVAELISFLASDRASYISGQVIDVDGAYGC